MARSQAKTVDSLKASLPSLHEARKDITAEQSMVVLRIMTVVYDIMSPDPSWFVHAVQKASQSTGISDHQIREIWSHYERTGLFYETLREPPVLPPDAVKLHEAALEYIDHTLPILASRGTVLSNKGVVELLRLEFGIEFTRYHVKQMTDELGYRYGRVPQDWTVGMKSERRQRQLLLHLLMLDQALAEVEAGKAVILFTDQTFIDTCAHMRFGLWKPGATHAYFPKGTGVRVAHMHALTCYSLLAVNSVDEKPIFPPRCDDVPGFRASEDALTAELTFDLKRKKSGGVEEKAEKPGFSAEVCVLLFFACASQHRLPAFMAGLRKLGYPPTSARCPRNLACADEAVCVHGQLLGSHGARRVKVLAINWHWAHPSVEPRGPASRGL